MAQNDFDPAPQAAPQGPPPEGEDNQGGVDVGNLASRWSDWISRPSNSAALMQFGIAMMQPNTSGGSGVANFANAVGAGGEAAGRVQEQERRQEEVESKSQLREAGATLAEERARNAGVATQNKLMATQLTDAYHREQLENQRTLATIRANNEYHNYIQKIQKDNNDAALTGGTQQPIPTFEEYSRGAHPEQMQDAVTPENLASKPPLAEWIKGHRQTWERAKAAINAKTPESESYLRGLRSRVSDPQALDAALKESPK